MSSSNRLYNLTLKILKPITQFIITTDNITLAKQKFETNTRIIIPLF